MARPPLSLQPFRRLAGALALFALLLSGLVPAGWMPHAEGSTLALSICTRAGAQAFMPGSAAADPAAPAEDKRQAEAACLFAALSAAALPPADGGGVLPARPSEAAGRPAVLLPSAVHRADLRLPPAQGPPPPV